MACGLSMQDIFILPHPRVITDSTRYCHMVYITTQARIWSDDQHLSDSLAIIKLVCEYLRFKTSTMLQQQRNGYQQQRGDRLVVSWTQ